MVSIYFVGPYPPIMCGIADYTSFLTRVCPAGQWGILSFDLDRYGAPLVGDGKLATDRVWYGIPGRDGYSAEAIRQGLKESEVEDKGVVLWFQHEFGIWPDDDRFVAMLKGLDVPKVVSFHTLHFQSPETPSGLGHRQYELLSMLLPYVEAITVFSHGVYRAVTLAFPECSNKVYLIRHGVHSYPDVCSLSRQEAKEKVNDFLLYRSDLDQETKNALEKQRVLLDMETVVLGETGFLRPAKQSELLYSVRDRLQEVMPERKIVAVRVGSVRDAAYSMYPGQLYQERDNLSKFLLEIWLPHEVFPLTQRAFDINFHWPSECTQSGVLAHVLGAGAVVAGRDLEGVGETLKEAGQLLDTDLGRLILKIKDAIINPEVRKRVEEATSQYAGLFSWENQVRCHYEMAESILRTLSLGA
ncbi:MAG: hypothetical protein JSW16_08560 [Dehalococcoidales bacterium]|nr:MAG: hypothetical protein JSW16_08560 [Dehalococcoidales bacterium]